VETTYWTRLLVSEEREGERDELCLLYKVLPSRSVHIPLVEIANDPAGIMRFPRNQLQQYDQANSICFSGVFQKLDGPTGSSSVLRKALAVWQTRFRQIQLSEMK